MPLKGSELLAGTAKAATYNIFLQLSIRVMTFLLNAVVLRYISKDMLGVVNVRLTLLYSTTLFISTEGFDQACLSKIEGKNWTQVVNLMWCTSPICIACCCFFALLWMILPDQPDPDIVPYYGWGVVSFVVSTIITVLARPHFIVGQAHLFVKLRVLSVGLSELVKCITVVVLVMNYPQLGLINFSIAQILCGVTYTGLYYLTFYWYLNDRSKPADFVYQKIRDFFPKKPMEMPYLDDRLLSLSFSFCKQSFLKQFLTEGEKYVMTIFGALSFGDQGVYDVINNLGSMAPRFIFLPIEESGRIFFSQSLVRGKTHKDQAQESLDLATKVLQHLLKIVMLLGSVILVFGYAYSYLALDLYGGQVLSSGSGPTLLRWYCLYVLIIAVNGITECFFFAAMSKAQIDKYNKKMVLFSAIFLSASLILTKTFGSVGFVLANCLNMGTRIVHSIYFIKQYYHGSQYCPLTGLMPSKSFLASLIVSSVVTVTSEMVFCCEQGVLYRILHIGIGAVCLLCVLATVYLTETDLISFVHKQYSSQKSAKENKEE